MTMRLHTHFLFEKAILWETQHSWKKRLEDNTVDAIYAKMFPLLRRKDPYKPSFFPFILLTFKGNPIMEYLNYAQTVILNVNPNF